VSRGTDSLAARRLSRQALNLLVMEVAEDMSLFSARRFASACILSAGAVIALAAPGAANATLGTQCSGANLKGGGSSLQNLAQVETWGPEFNKSSNATACSGTQGSKGTPKITYEGTLGSGGGMEKWGINGKTLDASFGYIGTDEPPDATQLKEIQEESSSSAEASVETIPVLQGAVAVIVNLPAGCTATAPKFTGRLVLNNVTLEKIWRGEVTKWTEITDGGDKFTGTCSSEIKRVVRLDQSGTSHIFKKYLALIHGAKDVFEGKGWSEISEGPANVNDWPGTVLRPSGTGGGKEVSKVAETPSSIGYANLADAYNNGGFIPPGGGAKTAKFWTPIQDNGLSTEGAKYADPAIKKEKATLGNANCKKTEYTNGAGAAFPPKSTLDTPWNEVTTSTTEPKYTLCGLTYDLAIKGYSKYPGMTLQEATSASNYLLFELSTKAGGGQKLIKNKNYEELAKGPVSTEANAGAKEVTF
jgi:ABC-type phosphate transport system substrate-binding protein